MISSLSIRNYALIKSLHITPETGLNIVTGETGAGKSIMLGAVGLLLGNRADTKALLDSESKCVIEGEFDIQALDLKPLFDVHDLDYEASTIIRREITPAGKSRAFINDVPATLDVLKAIGLRLIDVHSQNESIQLGDKTRKMQVIDAFSQSKSLLSDYQLAYDRYGQLSKELELLESRSASSKQDADYKQFMLDELQKAELLEDEQQALEEELQLLEHAEEIKLSLSQVTNEFEGHDQSINDKLRETVQLLSKVSGFSKEIEALQARFEQATEEIIDVVRDLSSEQERIEHNPERLTEVSERLDLINRLQQKHQVGTNAELLTLQSQLEGELLGTLDLDEAIKTKHVELSKAEKAMITAAEKLSENRRSHIDTFSNTINELLAGVGMPDGKVEMVYKRVSPWALGIDEVEILFSANKGITPEPVAKVASGGEYSRLMFCIKYLLAEKTAMPTVIFDEIDTGVSGEIAIKLANMMRKMAERHQLIAISHLPQVAAKGDAHYFVYKDSQAEKTESLIKKLEGDDRLEAIAKMIGGDSPSETALDSARELIAKT